MDRKSMKITKDFFVILEPFFIVTRLFGLCPIVYQKIHNGYLLVWSFKYFVYSYLIASILSISALIGIRNDFLLGSEKSTRMKDEKSKYITCCDVAFIVFIASYSIYTIPLKFKTLHKLLTVFKKIEERMLITIPLQSIRKDLYVLRAIFLYFIVLLIFDFFMWKYKSTGWYFLQNYLPFYILYFIMIVQQLFYSHLIVIIKLLLSMINNRLREMKLSQRIQNNHFRKIQIEFLPRIIMDEKDRDEILKYTNVNSFSTLVKSYNKILDVTRVLNQNSSEIVIILISCLFHLTITPYFFLVGFAKLGNGNINFILIQLCWIFAHILRLFLIVLPCEFCLKQAHFIKYNVFELLLCNNSNDIQQMLTIFATQLSCCELEFSLCGFITISKNIVTTVAGTVMIYLVILLQFYQNKVID